MSLAAPSPPIRLHANADTSVVGVDSVLQRESSATRDEEAVAKAHPGLLRDLIVLTKPRIVIMVLVTTGVAAVVAAGWQLSPLVLLHALLGTAAVGASAGTMNQIWERRLDCGMKRTRSRPLPAGRITLFWAVVYCGVLGITGTAYLSWFSGPAPAFFGIATWLTYVLIYTPMKTRTSWNTTVGAVSGALPMMIGYTAAGGDVLGIRGWLLVAVLVAWQYPHFMAIAWMYRREYGEAGFLMTPVVEPTGRSAAAQSVVGAFALLAVLVALVWMTASGWSAVGLSLLMVAVSFGLVRDSIRFAYLKTDASARRMMFASLLQLPSAMIVLVIAALV
ncbi:Protoheme IX farnesyltransferase 1 [Roseimaritima multifibrata]|uniref:Protoheme IX farnesyltransferase n=1 Tax=Roseimaritima multifibrata TaxID=1930274 RepID=A0A517MMP7_9BACT|nr:protoheme IX farnesyltransferase [Roseimaritima multifibrata]QDS96159.1 Protoheme IX farnesyltransferase 1 [Roseimaritima multifibrata]